MATTTSILSPRAALFREKLREQFPELKRDYGVAWLGLFGSYVRGEESLDSDLDVLVEFDCTPDLFAFVALQQKLSDLLGVQVDLVMKRALKSSLRERIIHEVVEL